MTEAQAIRLGTPDDARACAAILNAWIDATGWMPRVHARADVERHYSEVVFEQRAVIVLGNPSQAFLALDPEGCVTALYCGKPGTGQGKALLDHAKGLRSDLNLWVFKANLGAQRFYEREGFAIADRSDGDNEEGLPDIFYQWRAA